MEIEVEYLQSIYQFLCNIKFTYKMGVMFYVYVLNFISSGDLNV